MKESECPCELYTCQQDMIKTLKVYVKNLEHQLEKDKLARPTRAQMIPIRGGKFKKELTH